MLKLYHFNDSLIQDNAEAFENQINLKSHPVSISPKVILNNSIFPPQFDEFF
jgi:hypothetical protein